MGDDTPIEALSTAELMERSSLGSQLARVRRDRTPPEVTQLLLGRITRQATDGRNAGGAADAPAAGRRPYFFLSYARDGSSTGVRDLADVRRFFGHLCTYLSQVAPDIAFDETASSPVVPGYLAGDPWVGSSRQSGTLDALVSCRIFVPLLCPAYVGDSLCRGESASFRRRDDVHRRYNPFVLSAIVPVLWEPVPEADLPRWAADRRLLDDTLGPDYAEQGLHALMAGASPAYDKAVYRIARRIHDVSECLQPAD